ncbi:MAG: riboflavin kinase [Candidatus Gracilibacteria bacterium]
MKFTGKVVHGAGRGAKIGYPTINLELVGKAVFADLAYGVYAVRVAVEQKKYSGVMHFGPRPTFSDASEQVEIYLLDFNGDLYDQKVTVEVSSKIRDVIGFDSEDALRQQIAKDVFIARGLFS